MRLRWVPPLPSCVAAAACQSSAMSTRRSAAPGGWQGSSGRGQVKRVRGLLPGYLHCMHPEQQWCCCAVHGWQPRNPTAD